LRVLALFLESPDNPRYGLEISKEAQVRPSSLYPLLARLEAAGWLESEWETVDPHTERRPARRWYRLTRLGTAEARRELEPLVARLRALGPALGGL
jgi:PadR family transcriptional regulator, regulatory protein PadR